MLREENLKISKEVAITHRSIKANIKKQMLNQNISISNLSQKTNINKYILIFLLYFPPSRLKLSHAIKICKVLKVKVSDIVC